MTEQPTLQAPFPWFGGKSRVAGLVWKCFGNVANYVEPFFGSGAVLLGRPHPPRIETVNDKDGFIANFWRAMQAVPNEVAAWANWPVNENDLTARHIWLVQRRAELTARLEGDPDYYDAKIAGWWVWGICCWIGSGWCSGEGPWTSVDGVLNRRNGNGGDVWKMRPHLGHAGHGINRQLPHLGNEGTGLHRTGVYPKRPHLASAKGVYRQLPHSSDNGAGSGVHRNEPLQEWFAALSARLRRVRVCCGDWTRVLGLSPTTKLGLTAVFLDPPYAGAERDSGLYAVDHDTVATDVRRWAIEHGDDPLLRVALCGYDTEHEMPASWTAVPWKAHGGYGSQGEGRGRENAGREVVWFSKACLQPQHQQPSLFALDA